MIEERVKSGLWHGTRYVVAGAGVSGNAAARLLLSMGKQVMLIDDSDRSATDEVKALAAQGATFHWGKLTVDEATALLAGTDALIPSPGVPNEAPIREAARRLRIRSAGEIELGWLRSRKAKFAAITGTNGKTTVTMLVRHILAHAGMNAVESGNIGYSLADGVREGADQLDSTVFSLEVSSFQLDDIEHFNPEVGLILNVTPDHLDRHHTMEEYAKAKARVTLNQGPAQTLVVNQDDAWCLKIAAESKARILKFSLLRPVEEGAWLDDDTLTLTLAGQKPRTLTQLDKLQLIGMHNVSNSLAAACVAAALGVSAKKIGEALESFGAAPHRLELIATLGGVDYINDSKATNIDAMVKAIESFSAPVHLIAGGRDKDSPFETVLSALEGRVVRAYLIGEAADKIERAWASGIPIERSVTMDAALTAAAAHALGGEIVLLAPGCASFDQFKDYKDRGEKFTAWVRGRELESTANEETLP